MARPTDVAGDTDDPTSDDPAREESWGDLADDAFDDDPDDDVRLEDPEDLPADGRLKEAAKVIAVLPAVLIGGALFAVIAGMVAAGFGLMLLAFAPSDSGDDPYAATVTRQGLCVESDDDFIQAIVSGDGISEIADGIDLDEADDDGQTALYCAAAHGENADAETLLVAGASPDFKAAGGTPLVAVVARGHTDVVESLLESGADVTGGEPQSALAVALEHRRPGMVDRLLNAGASATEPVPLEMPAVDGGRLTEVGEAELEAPEAATDGLVAVLLLSGELPLPPLHAAALANDPESMSLLVERGADVNQWVYAGLTPLHVAIIADSPDAVEALLAVGVDPNTTIDPATGSPISLATALGRDDILQQLS